MIRQSRAAFPHEITPLKTAETIKLCNLLYTKYMAEAHRPEVNVLKTGKKTISINILRFNYLFNVIPKKNFRPRRSIPNTAMMLLGIADATVINDSKKTALSILSEHSPFCCCVPEFTTKLVTSHTDADWPG